MDGEAEATRRIAAGDSPPEREQTLDELIARRADRLANRLVRGGDDAIDEAALGEVRALRDLAWLNEQRAAAAPATRRNKLLMPLLLGTTALVMTGLVVLRLPSIRVDIDVLCSAVTMRVAGPIQLTGLSPLKLLQGAEFRPDAVENPVTLQPIAFRPPIELRPLDEGSITLSSISIPGGALLSLQGEPGVGTWRVSIEHDAAQIDATLAGQVELSSDGSAEPMAFGRGSLLTLRAGTAPASRLDVLVTPERADALLSGRRIPVTAVSFEEAVQESLGSSGVVQARASSVLEGSIFNVALGGREQRLRTRDMLDVNVASGEVRELRLEEGGMRVGFSGEADELRLGRFGGMQTLRPTYLEWLAEHHALKLAWGAAAWLFALVVGGMKWWQGFRV